MKYVNQLTLLLILVLSCRYAIAKENPVLLQIEKATEIAEQTEVVAQLNDLHDLHSGVPEYSFQIHKALSMAHFRMSHFNKAIEHASAALLVAQKSNMQPEAAVAHKYIGIMYYYLGDLPDAITAYEKALSIFKAQDIALEQANTLNNMGLVYASMGESGKALNAYQQAEPIYQRYGSEMDKVDIRYNIAGLYLRLKRYTLAIDMLHQTIERRIQLDDEQGLAQAYADIGVAYKHARQFQNAEHYMNKAMDYYLGSKDYYNVASQYQNLANLSVLTERYSEAETYALEAIALSQKFEHKKVLASSLNDLATILTYKGLLDEAMVKVTESAALARELDYQPLVAENIGLFALINAGQQNMPESLRDYHQFMHEKVKLSGEDLNQQLAQFEAQQLTQQVRVLEQNKRVEELKKDKRQQRWVYALMLIIAVFFLMLSIYRRYVDKKLKIELEEKVRQRTLELEIANKKLYDLSYQDSTTSLHNRRRFDLDIAQSWQSYKKYDQQLTLVMLSIDKFTKYNEIYGHSAGEEVLKKVTQSLKQVFEPDAKVYRFVDDNFAVVLPNINDTEAEKITTTVINKVYELAIPYSESMHQVVTLSAGLCQLDSEMHSINQLIDKVDQRLYIAIKSGRNHVVSDLSKPS